MKLEYKYDEYDPGMTIIYLLEKTIGISKLQIVSFFLNYTNQHPTFYFCSHSNIKRITNQKQFELPKRNIFDQKKVKIQKLINLPVAIQNQFQPQQTLLTSAENSNNVLTIRFYNLVDKQWDFIYILVDKYLIESVLSKILSSGFQLSNKKDKTGILESFFKIIYPFLEESKNNELQKYMFIEDISHSVKSSISIQNKLEKRIEELEISQKSDLNKKVDRIMESYQTSGINLRLNTNAKKFVQMYKGNENLLIEAIKEAAKTTLNMYKIGGISAPEINEKYIEINLQKDDLFTSDKNKKRIEKAKYFLDKYDDAANIALARIRKVNIYTVSANVQPSSVKPPAISANIKKYGGQMRFLLEANQSKWLVLRNEFEPIKKLLK